MKIVSFNLIFFFKIVILKNKSIKNFKFENTLNLCKLKLLSFLRIIFLKIFSPKPDKMKYLI